MENRQIKISSNIDATVGISDPQLRFTRTWERKGVVRSIDFNTLQELCYNPGTFGLFTRGILYIDDMEAKRELGLEPYDATEPTNIVVLTDQQRQRYLKFAPIQDLKQVCKTLSPNEIDNLIDYAIDNQIIDYDKCMYLKEISGRDIIKTIELNKLDTSV